MSDTVEVSRSDLAILRNTFFRLACTAYLPFNNMSNDEISFRARFELAEHQIIDEHDANELLHKIDTKLET